MYRLYALPRRDAPETVRACSDLFLARTGQRPSVALVHPDRLPELTAVATPQPAFPALETAAGSGLTVRSRLAGEPHPQPGDLLLA